MKARELCNDIRQFETNQFRTSGPLDMASSTLEKTEILNENIELKRIIKELISDLKWAQDELIQKIEYQIKEKQTPTFNRN